ncbi:hypothetical protein EYC84_006856 [Monilinia fructicola]|uniref:Uncharacterized protein n=1 Tax=Monilinia fructicola TaxID=38448 RepID=A0A5M9K8J4_MONFR|nr:hypothetical protein EYC84_006856 [Monilinia fructicola]
MLKKRPAVCVPTQPSFSDQNTVILALYKRDCRAQLLAMAIGVLRVKLTGEPDKVTHKVVGSLPIFSVVAPWVSVTGPGSVTGIGVEQVLPFAESVKPVIVEVVVSSLYDKLAPQPSRVTRFVNMAES